MVLGTYPRRFFLRFSEFLWASTDTAFQGVPYSSSTGSQSSLGPQDDYFGDIPHLVDFSSPVELLEISEPQHAYENLSSSSSRDDSEWLFQSLATSLSNTPW
jgi:hypothetical protein